MEKNKVQVLKTQEEGAGEGEIYNPVFYERIPLDYLRQAAQHAYDNPADVSANLGARIDEEYLERVLNAKDATTGEALGVAWYDRYGNDVTALRTRGLKLKATLVGTETEASDYGGSMNYTSQELGLCTNGGLSNPCLDGGSNKYTWGKAFNDLDPRGRNVSNKTTFGLFKIEWVVDPDYEGTRNDGTKSHYITDPADSRFLDENELITGSQLDEANRRLRPVDRPDYTSAVVEVGDTVSIAFPVRAAEENLPQVYKNLDDSTTTATNADGTANTTGLKPAYLPRLGEYYFSSYHLHCGHAGCAAGGFFTNPGVGVTDFGLSNAVTGVNRVATENVLMDMDSLLHESAFTADKPKHVDTYEMFNHAYTFIPGTASNVKRPSGGYIAENVTNTTNWENSNDYGSSGSNGQFMDADVVTANNKQKVSYLLTGTPTTGTVADAAMGLPNQFSLVSKDSWSLSGSTTTGKVARDYFTFVTSSRIADALATVTGGRSNTQTEVVNLGTGEGSLRESAAKLSATPLVWSQTRLHMQKAWLTTTSEMVSDFDSRVGDANAADDYQAARQTEAA